MKTSDEIHRSFSRVPANQYLNFELVSQSADEVVVRMEVGPDQIQETGVVHGGLLGAVADTAAVYVFHPYLPDDRSMASIEFKMNFLRPATANRGPVVARSKVLRRGRKIGVCEVELSQADVLVAKGLFTYMFIERGEWNEDANNSKSS